LKKKLKKKNNRRDEEKMVITTEMIKKLREATGAGVLDCRKALEQSDGDFNKAVDFLREKGLSLAAKRSERKASEGVVEIYSHGNGRIGVMVEVNCETDFVGRSAEFRKFAHEVALQVAAMSPAYIREEDIPADVIEHESTIAANKAREEGKPEAVLPRIVEGYLKKFKDETVLLRQIYIRDENVTIQQLLNQNIAAIGENIVIRRFSRWALGEGEAQE
jgi:elongation factor Ts